MSIERHKGFTLIELLLYIATASLLLLAISSFAILLSESRIKHRTISEVEQQGQFMMEVMTQSVRNAEDITSPTIGTTGSTLILDVVDATNDPTTFSISGDVLQISEGSTPTVTDISSSTVSVSDLAITNLSRQNTAQTVQIEFIVTAVNPTGRNEYDFTQTFSTTATVRND